MIRVSQPEPNKLRGPGNLDVFSSVWSRLVGKNNLGETVCGAHTHTIQTIDRRPIALRYVDWPIVTESYRWAATCQKGRQIIIKLKKI